MGTEQHKSLGQNPESCLFQIQLSIPNDLMELLLKIINIHLVFHFRTIEELLSYQAKQCTSKSKSLKMSVDVHQVLIPPIWVPFHDPLPYCPMDISRFTYSEIPS